MSARKDQALAARADLVAAIERLGSASLGVERIVGSNHDAAASVEAARQSARVAAAKLDLLIKRIP